MGGDRSATIALERPARDGTSFGSPEDILTYAVMPVQFRDLWSRPAALSPECNLALAVVEEGLNDLVRFRFARRRRAQRLYWEAYAWVGDDDREWPFSFVNLCEVLDLDVDGIRRQFLDPMKVPRTSGVRIDPAALPKAA